MSDHNVSIYTMDGCPHCNAAKEFLRKHDVEFNELDVYESDDIWKEAMDKADGNDIVPVIDIDGQIIYGAWSDIQDDLAEAIEA
jgi:glutaredoxin